MTAMPMTTRAMIRACFVAIVATEPREADVQVLERVIGEGHPDPGTNPVQVAIDPAYDIAEYLWDHWMGEPTWPSPAAVEAMCRALIDEARKGIGEDGELPESWDWTLDA